MKSISKLLITAFTAAAAMAVMAFGASAADYEFDVSEAIEVSEWKQSITYYTPYADPTDTALADHFDPTWMTEDSEVIITYESDMGENAPLELIWQTWGDPLPEGVYRGWNKVHPYEYNESEAKFSYEDIRSSYGTEDFSCVYAICVGDTGVRLKVTGMTITNCNIPGAEEETEPEETEAAETEAETEKVTEKETEATTAEKIKETEETTTMATLPVPVNDDDDEGVSSTVIIIVIVAAVVIAAIAVAVVLMVKKAKNKYY